jgi:aspartyl protease family protein
MSGDQIARLIYLGLLVAAIGSYVLVAHRGRMGQGLRHAALWGLIFVGAIVSYGLWGDLRDAVTPRQWVGADGRIEVPRGPDGHYRLTVTVNGTPLRFVVDTGASDIVLSRADAARVGLSPGSLVFDGTAITANGRVPTASVRLAAVEIGPFRDESVPAVVNGGALDSSLLGMRYLERFAEISFSGGRLVLTR